MASITSVTLEVDDVAAAEKFYAAAFGLGDRLRFREGGEPTSGFRGYTLSTVVSQPANVELFFDAAVAAGATVLQAVEKSLWGIGGLVQAPDGAIWNIATSNKKDSGPAAREVESFVLLLGVEDAKASKRFYEERGFATAKSMGGYVEFEPAGSPVQLGLLKRKALAKSAAVSADGSGSHRILINGDLGAATDPDGFVWE